MRVAPSGRVFSAGRRYARSVAARLSPGEENALRAFRERARAIGGDNLVRLALFGSRARGEGHEDSDLDVLVLLKRADRAQRRALLDAAADIDDETGLRLSPVVLDEASYARSWPLHDAVEREGITL